MIKIMKFTKLNFNGINKKSSKNFIKRIATGSKAEKETKRDSYGHCGNYSTRVCLFCGKCWYNDHT